jgi:broad specificity phosphatase PhoE
MSAGRLILVKHAMPVVLPGVPAAQWVLGEAGRAGARALAGEIANFGPTAVVASLEPKARETGEIVARELGVPFETAADLHEHERRTVVFEASRGQFEANVRAFFERPDELVYGEETARQAGDRFERAVRGLLERHPVGTLVVIAHGTVISLLVSRWRGDDPFTLWGSLGLPSFVVLPLP